MNQEEIGERLAALETKIDIVLSNHLPHLDAKINWIICLIVTTLISTVFFLLKK